MSRKMSAMYLQFAFNSTTTVITLPLTENGYVKTIVIEMPTFTNGVTGVLTINDPVKTISSYNVLLYTSPSVVNGGTYKIGDDITAGEPAEVPVGESFTATLTLSGAAGGTGGTVFVAMYVKF